MIAKADAKRIDILNEQSEPKRTQNVGRRVVEVEACGAAVLNIGPGEDDGQDEEVKPPTRHTKLHKRFILEPVDYVFEEFIRKVGE
jgi:hypothetical protein